MEWMKMLCFFPRRWKKIKYGSKFRCFNVLNQRSSPKFVIIYATHAGADVGVWAFKISVLRQKLVIICPTCAGANLGVFAFKIKVLSQKLVIICATLAGVNLRVLAFKISVLRQKK